jgi:hypothetical protein
LQSDLEDWLLGGGIGFDRRMQLEVMIDHAGLADAGGSQDRATGRFAGLRLGLVAAFEQLDGIPKSWMQNDQFVSDVESFGRRDIPPRTTISTDVWRAGWGGHVGLLGVGE